MSLSPHFHNLGSLANRSFRGHWEPQILNGDLAMRQWNLRSSTARWDILFFSFANVKLRIKQIIR